MQQVWALKINAIKLKKQSIYWSKERPVDYVSAGLFLTKN